MPLAQLGIAIGELKERVAALEREMATIKHWSTRFAILVALWVIAILGNLSAEQIAQILVTAIKSL